MRINVYGLGYVGVVSAACFAKNGHKVTGIDVDPLKVSLINKDKSPIVEPGLEELIKETRNSGHFTATVDNIPQADVSFVCVGTPSNENGSLKLDYIIKVSQQIGEYLKKEDQFHVVNFRSTVLPGTIEEVLIPILEEFSHKKAGKEFGVCMNPEFMREGTSIQDFYTPPFTIIGGTDDASIETVSQIYHNVVAPLFKTTIRVAEMVKYASNAFHALKVTFANEIGNICKKLNINSHEVMNIFCQDTKLNLSSYYLKPGFAFGGSCLPKDLRAILYKAKELDLNTPVLSSILTSNELQIKVALDMIQKSNRKKVGILGLSFKAGTDDLRESPLVELIERLIGKGYSVSIFDKEVSLARIYGSNKKFIETAIPHISSLLKESAMQVIEESEVIVIGNNSNEAKSVIPHVKNGKIVIDLVKITSELNGDIQNYQGICW